MEITRDLKRILDITISLMSEDSHKLILDRILKESMEISNCDAATLYILKDNKLYFYIMRNNKMRTYEGLDKPINLPPVELNETTVSGYCAIHKEIVNIKDVYNDNKFNWDGPKKYDALTGYKTKSQLVIPLIDKEGRLIGVMQLINAIKAGEITYFTKDMEYIIYSLAVEAAILLSNQMLFDNIRTLLDSFVRAMTMAIDSRTPYNANHTINVCRLCGEFVDYLNNECGYKISADDKDELKLAAMLHDVGKMIVPLNILNKEDRLSDKLKGMLDRFKIIKLDLRCSYLEGKITAYENERLQKLIIDSEEFILKVNKVGYLDSESEKRIHELKKYQFQTRYGNLSLINDDEYEALLIKKGTLSAKERELVNMHVVYTNKILSEISFGEKYKNVLYITSSHHEYLDGSGYPKGLKADAITLPVRILTIMDVYESLTSNDRPYKKAISKDKAYNILKEMADEGKLDNRLVGLMQYYLGL